MWSVSRSPPTEFHAQGDPAQNARSPLLPVHLGATPPCSGWFWKPLSAFLGVPRLVGEWRFGLATEGCLFCLLLGKLEKWLLAAGKLPGQRVYSPRTRGWALASYTRRRIGALLPAHAGMGPSGRARRGWWSPAPRACGDPSHLDRYRVSGDRGTAIRRRGASGSGRRGPLTDGSHQPAAPSRDQPTALGPSTGP